MAKRMRAAAKMPEESLKSMKAPEIVVQTSIEQDEETTFRLVFKRKRKATTLPAEHSHSDGRTPHRSTVHSKGHQDVIVVQECEVGSSKGNSLWD